MTLTRETFRLSGAPAAQDLRDHPVWAAYTEPTDHAFIVGWGIDPTWLDNTLGSFAGFVEGYTHPMFPVLDLTIVDELAHVVVAADFMMANGSAAFGFLAGTHAVGVFVGDDVAILNRNLRELSRDAARRIEAALSTPAFPATWRARAPYAEAGEHGTIEAWW